MAGVTVIKGVEVTGAKSEPTDGNLKRVAAYCRVSTDEAEQLVSYSSQIKYYTDLINSRSDWQMAGIYADESITGTIAYKRDNFLKLIADCKAGKIDMVITNIKTPYLIQNPKEDACLGSACYKGFRGFFVSQQLAYQNISR